MMLLGFGLSGFWLRARQSDAAGVAEGRSSMGNGRRRAAIFVCAMPQRQATRHRHVGRQIAENSAVDGGVVVACMLSSEGNLGFDAAQKQYVDLVEAGIIDPTKVVRIALENAVSIASVLLLTEATMTEIPEAKKKRAPELELEMLSLP